MDGHRGLIWVIAGLGFFCSTGVADAAVAGKAFPVNLTTNKTTTVTRNFVFGDDGGEPNTGPFSIMEGGDGTWNQLPIGTISFWSVGYTAGQQTAYLIGIQIGTRVWAVGADRAGNQLVARPWTP